MSSPGERSLPSEVPEEGNSLQRFPRQRLSVPLGQTDESPGTPPCDVEHRTRGENVVLGARLAGPDGSQVVGSEDREDASLWRRGLPAAARRSYHSAPGTLPLHFSQVIKIKL